MKFPLLRLGLFVLLLGVNVAALASEALPASAQGLWQGVVLEFKPVTLTATELSRIEKSSGEKVRSPFVERWLGSRGEILVLDKVVGKHELITYALAVTKDLRVQGLEILDYRETYGYQIKDAAWRQRFVGKGPEAALKLGQDVDAISGATLSASHVAGGVRRVLRTLEILREDGLK